MSIKLFASIMVCISALFVWRNVYSAPCFLSLPIPLFVIVVVSMGLIEQAVTQRDCFANCYFKRRSIIYQFVRSRTVISTVSFLAAAAAGTALALDLITFTNGPLAFVALDSLFVCWLFLWLVRTTVGSVKDEMRYVLTKSWVVSANVPLGVIALAIMQLYSAPPDYLRPDLLGETVIGASGSVHSECRPIDFLAKLSVESDAIFWWLMINGSRLINNDNLRWVWWTTFLLGGGMSLWAYSRFLVQMVSFVHQLENKHAQRGEYDD